MIKRVNAVPLTLSAVRPPSNVHSAGRPPAAVTSLAVRPLSKKEAAALLQTAIGCQAAGAAVKPEASKYAAALPYLEPKSFG